MRQKTIKLGNYKLFSYIRTVIYHSISDIDECANAPCHERATCTNIPGTYDCMCNSGYTGDGQNSCRGNFLLFLLPII